MTEKELKEMDEYTVQELFEISESLKNRSKIMNFFWFVLAVLFVFAEDVYLSLFFLGFGITAAIISSSFKSKSEAYHMVADIKTIEQEINKQYGER